MSDQKPIKRQWLYSASCPAGQIFEGDAIADGLKNGWQKRPPSKEETDAAAAKQSAEAETSALAEADATIVTLKARVEELEGQNGAEQIAELNAEIKGLKADVAKHKGETKKAKAELAKAQK